MIDENEPVFPNIAVAPIMEAMGRIDEEVQVFARALRNTDPNVSIGVQAAIWTPVRDSFEMRGGPVGRSEPTLQQYIVTVQGYVKDADEVRGLGRHAVLANRIRSVLDRDPLLAVAFQSMRTETTGVVERLKRWGINTQRFHSNEIKSQFLYLSTLEFFLETETI